MISQRMLSIAAGAIWLLAPAAAAQAPRPEIPPAQRPAARATVVAERVEAVLDGLEQTGDFRAARRETVKLLERVITFAPLDEPELFRRAGLADRLVQQLARAEQARRIRLLGYLRKNRLLAAALVFTVRPGDRLPGVFAVVDRLRATHGDHLNRYANLVAALAVVHDGKGAAGAARAAELFEDYVRHEGQMRYGIRHVPPELLIFVVDTPAGIDELEWALDKFAGDTNVGHRFSDVPYDEMHQARGKQKRIGGKPYTLANLRRYGGVCSDQAYFASNVGKAIGVPAVAASGHAGDQAHSWVGFFEARGPRNGRWNFEVGRGHQYRQVRGWVPDAQLGRNVAESHVAVLAELIGTRPEGRHQAIAFSDAARRLRFMGRRQQSRAEPLLPGPGGGRRRNADAKSQLELIEAGLRKSPACAACWQGVATLAALGKLSFEQIRAWADRLHRAFGKEYPDFSADHLRPLIRAIKDVEQQDRTWENAIRYFKRRFDLVAELRMAQAAMWEKANRPGRALACYRMVLDKYANDGPFVLTALARAERLLRERGRADRVPALYEQTWARIRMPTAAHNKRASNWYQVGMAYLRVLEASHDRPRAQHVKNRIRKVAG